MKKSINRIFTLTSRNLKEIIRDPLSLIFMVGLPIFMEILFYFIFHKLTPQFEMKYLAPGIVVFSQTFLSLFMGMLISLDRNTSFLTRLFVSEAKPYEFIFSYTLALIPICLVQSVLFFVIGGIIDPSIFSVNIIFAILLSIITAFLFIGLGILLGSLCNEKSIGGVSSLVIVCQSVLSGMWFPLEGMSEGFLTMMKILPFKNMTMIVQNALNGYTDFFKDLLLPIIIVLSYTIVVFIISIFVFRKKMKSN